ncbi:MAG: transposase family protein, partial [Nostoc sp. DedQUE01]
VMIDGTERPIARPQDPEQQKHNYSGKKKRHTRKHLAAVDETKRILILTLFCHFPYSQSLKALSVSQYRLSY